MEMKDVLILVEDLFTQEKELDFVIRHLFENKVYYFHGICAVSSVYKIEFDEVSQLFYAYDGYKESMEQVNPFNEDFINFVEENG